MVPQPREAPWAVLGHLADGCRVVPAWRGLTRAAVSLRTTSGLGAGLLAGGQAHHSGRHA